MNRLNKTIFAVLCMGVGLCAAVPARAQQGETFTPTGVEPRVAVHVSETTAAQWPALPGPHEEWKYWHIYGFLFESLKSDGTPTMQISDAEIAAGGLMTGAAPKYPMLISLAATSIPDATAEKIRTYVDAGGHVYVGSTAWTRDAAGMTNDAKDSRGVLWQAMGLSPQGVGLVGTTEKVGRHPVAEHLRETGPLNWLLPRSFTNIGFTHRQHWVQQVEAAGADVVLMSDGKPTLAVRDHGRGRFIYRAVFSPLAGYSGYVVDNFEYGFIRKAIEQAFDAQGVPLVRLSPWPYPYRAALKTRHDHFLHKAAADLEARHGVKGEWLLRTDEAIGAGDWKHLDAIVASGALIGSHTRNEHTLDSANYAVAEENVRQSLDALAARLGARPRIFVAPGMMAFRESSIQALVDNGLVTTGDLSHGPYPNFALKIDRSDRYGERFAILEIPVSRYPAKPGTTWNDLIHSHMDSMPLEIIRKTVDVTYELGGVINIYDHVGDPTPVLHAVWKHPTIEHLEFYLDYALAKPGVWKTDPLELLAWWTKRDAATIEPVLERSENGRLAIRVELRGPESAGPFAVDVQLPRRLAVASIRGDREREVTHEGRHLKLKTVSGATLLVVLQ